ncbi:MAG TPA: HIT domain-containing protein [Candidatus Omnitrophota bacterium]|nr:HIT domain-containing protein [Candidatus Omnitrophota bacterium]
MKSDKIWAPWRIKYITGSKKDKGCLFCRVSRSSNDKKNLLIFRTDHSVCLLNLYPYNNGHLMVAPKKHTASFDELTEKEALDLMKSVNKAVKLLTKTLKAQGFNVGINMGRVGGAGIEKHLHIHIVPRWTGDTNFMPIISNTKIISQSLDALYDALKENL